MQFVGTLTKAQLAHVDHCNERLNDPKRLNALQSTGLMDTPREEAFDRLCRLAARILNVPLTIVSLVDNQRQFFKADFGLPHPFSETRNLPIDFSLCRYTMAGDSIISNDTSKDSFLMCHPSTKPWGIGSLIVLPLITDQGHVLGTFCCIQPEPRVWTELDHEVMRELTASIMTEINLRSKVEKLKVEHNLRDTFVAAMTHDLRTPLTVMKMTAQTLMKRYPDDEQIKKSAVKIVENANRSDKMIQNLLEVNQLRAGNKINLIKAECDFNAIIREVADELGLVYNREIKLSLCEKGKLNADSSGLRRVVENLLCNAIKYGDSSLLIFVDTSLKSDTFELRVKNFGNPIPKEEQGNIFEAFHRTIDATTSGQKGWGLGLPLVRGLIEAHGGNVGVSSSLEEGTTFYVELPAK